MLLEATTSANLSVEIPTEHSTVTRLATVAFLATMAVFGTGGNILALLSVIRISKMQRFSYYLVANMSVVGLLVCVVVIPGHLLNSLHIRSEGILCHLQGYMNFMLTLAMLTNTNAIAIHRYIIVTRKRIDNQRLKRRKMIIIFASLWGVPALISLTSIPFIGYHVDMLDCFFDSDTESYWYAMATITAPAFLTTVLIFVCYFIILKTVRDSRKRVTPQAFLSRQEPSDMNEERSEVKRSEGEKTEAGESKTSGRESKKKDPPNIPVHVVPTNAADPTGAKTSPSLPTSSHAHILSRSQSYKMGNHSNSSDTSHTHASFNPGHTVDKDSLSPTEGSRAVFPSPALSCVASTSKSTPASPSRKDDFASTQAKRLPTACSQLIKIIDPDSGANPETEVSEARKMEESKMNRRLQQEIVLTIQLFLVFFVFCLLYLPICMVHVLDPFYHVSPDVWLTLFTLALSFSTITWILYALANRDFRQAYIAVLTCERTIT